MNKYEQAIVDYSTANEEIKRLTKEISRNLEFCSDLDENGKSLHLRKAFTSEYVVSGDCFVPKTDKEQSEYLASVCKYCLAAHKLIHERIQARKDFGVTKRRIAILAKGLMA